MSTLGNFIRSIAVQLRGPYRPNQYGTVIHPFTVLRRLGSILEADLAASRQANAEEIANLVGGTDTSLTTLAARR